MKPRVFSGIQPSNSPTIGNYLGAIQYWVRDQQRFDSIFCVVDLHAMTLPHQPRELRQHTWELAAMLLACGIDPEQSLLFVQSHVAEHTTLCWLLNTVTPTGWLNRMTQFKTKAGREREAASAALYDYPVLMAADILAYHTNFVPVGEDQKQHVELTRDIASRFNALYGETFTIPEPMIPELGARIMSLDDPTSKMSKTAPGGALFLVDSSDVIRKKIARAVTDSIGVVRFNPEQAGLYNLLTMLQSLSGETSEEIESRFAGGGYAPLKQELGDRVIQALEPIQRRYHEYLAAPEIVDRILETGAEKARSMAAPVVRDAEQRLGLRFSGAQSGATAAAV
ncbi:MAG TPA: tryptophan--tRNA ligase [Chloroflexota bacterium]|nr:tryptophan--tRNA ligase [Chloroflexota bacterium]